MRWQLVFRILRAQPVEVGVVGVLKGVGGEDGGDEDGRSPAQHVLIGG